MAINGFQELLLNAVKLKLAKEQSLVDELASLFNISSDSAYRRIRGEKQLSLEEAIQLCTHYKISIDGLLNTPSDSFIFSGKKSKPSDFKFDEYLKNMLGNMKYMSSFKQKELYYLCKDIPIFHHYQFKDLAAFKYYFWMKTILHLPEFYKKKFSFDDYPEEFFQLGKASLDCYNQMDSVELWNIESINSTLRQIDYFREVKMYQNDSDLLRLYNSMEQLIEHLLNQAQLGYKFDPTASDRTPLGSYKMFYNEVITCDNSLMGIVDGVRVVYLTYNVFNFMITRDVAFCDNFYDNMQNLIRNSTLISTVDEKERIRFFNFMKEKIAKRKATLKI